MPSKNLIKAALFTPGPDGRWGLPAMLWGPPGSGKTATVKAIARQIGLPCFRLSPAEKGEGQFGVIPVPGDDGFLHYPAPDWAKDLANGGVLFVDEISCATPALQAYLLGLVQFGTLGSHTFQPRVRIIGAANETGDAAGGWDLAPAVQNRLAHLYFEGAEASTWSSMLLSRFQPSAEESVPIDAAAEEQRVMAAFPAAYASASGLVAGFIVRRPELLHKQPEKGAKAKSRSWPSRRSWEHATLALTGAIVHGLTEVETDELLGAFVGENVCAELAKWRSEADLPDPVAVLDGKVAFEHDRRRLDRSLATLGACTSLVTQKDTDKSKRKARADKLWTILGEIIETTPDVAVPSARALVMGGLIGTNAPASSKILNKIAPVLNAAGIRATA